MKFNSFNIFDKFDVFIASFLPPPFIFFLSLSPLTHIPFLGYHLISYICVCECVCVYFLKSNHAEHKASSFEMIP